MCSSDLEQGARDAPRPIKDKVSWADVVKGTNPVTVVTNSNGKSASN